MTYVRSKCIVRKIGRGKTQLRKICFDKHGNIIANKPARATKKKTRKKR